ncbi:hypothetical protein VNO78_25759 [Psophocarpus tetragonolobus]|uniref:Uncharacterized protein n=1 Tax=Psophocarpus tetragonolobus TaxID=3891 RepID=A0AAN9S6G4_PSOTE
METLNKGNIYITATSPQAIYEAYFEQFQRDFKHFLKSRSNELKVGGIMLLTFMGRKNAHDFSSPSSVIGMALKDMVLQGLVEEAKLNSFIVPIYGPTMEEVRQIIEIEGSFTLQTLETFEMGWDFELEENVSDSVVDSKIRGEFIAKYIRSVYEPLLTAEFGNYIMDELFSRFAKKVSQLLEVDRLEYTNLVVSMKKT